MIHFFSRDTPTDENVHDCLSNDNVDNVSHTSHVRVCNDDLKVGFALLLLAVSLDVDEIDGSAHDLDEDVLRDGFEFDEDEWSGVIGLSQKREKVFFDDAILVIGGMGPVRYFANVVFIRKVLTCTGKIGEGKRGQGLK